MVPGSAALRTPRSYAVPCEFTPLLHGRTDIQSGKARPTDTRLTARYILGGVEKEEGDALVSDPNESFEAQPGAAVGAIGAFLSHGVAHPARSEAGGRWRLPFLIEWS